jgi:hypothetical protein
MASVNGAPPEQTPFQITRISSFGELEEEYFVANGVIKGFHSDVETSRCRSLAIPNTLWDEPVAAIGDNVFANKGLASIAIPDSVAAIGKNALPTINREGLP